MKKICLTLAAAILLTGCFTATIYQKAKKTFGFHDERISSDTYKVIFKGNTKTDMANVKDYAMLRAADIALELEYKYFSIIEKKSFYKVDKDKIHLRTGGVRIDERRFPITELDVRFHNDDSLADQAKTYNAKEEADEIRERHDM